MSAHPSRLRVLVADDAAETARRISTLLREAADIEVVGPALDGYEALKLFNALSPAGVVLDFNMPGLNGLAVLREIRARGRDCWVVILTNHAEPSIRDACLEAGADHFIPKAVAADRLAAIVSAYAGGNRA